MIAKCLNLKYEEGWYSSSQNTKKRDIKYEKGCVHWDNGNGWQKNFKSSKLILVVEYKDTKYEIWIDKFFKERNIRLIEKTRNLLIENMPKIINIVENVSDKGTVYYKVSEEDLYKWSLCLK